LGGADDDIAGDEYDEFSVDNELQSVNVSVISALRKKSRKELETIVVRILNCHPELIDDLDFTASGAAGKKACDAVVKAVTKAIVVTSKERGWRNYWKHTGHTPDYSSVRRGLQKLLDEGCADDVVRLGEKLFVKGTAQVEQSHDEGETADEIADTMPAVFKALGKCSLPAPDKLERAVDFGLRDEFGLCRGLEDFLQLRFGKKAWADLADRLLVRLKDMKPDSTGESFSHRYRRDRLSDEVIRALEKAGRAEEALAVCFQEAETTDSYERLIKKLCSEGRTNEAEEWIRKGVKATQDKLPGIASSLKKELLNIRRQKGDRLFVAALYADDFYGDPCLKTFENLHNASKKARVWQGVRVASLKFLESGAYPREDAGWPLPDTGFRRPEKPRRGPPPFTDVLTDIAIKEKRIDDVVRWYDLHKKRTRGWPETHRDDDVADKIVHKYPDRAIAIWKNIAEGLIAQTNVGAYGDAVTVLKKIHKSLIGLGRKVEWVTYLTDLTETNKRKSRLVQMLNVLSEKPILAK
jgi:uncharacterized Zn finger protein